MASVNVNVKEYKVNFLGGRMMLKEIFVKCLILLVVISGAYGDTIEFYEHITNAVVTNYLGTEDTHVDSALNGNQNNNYGSAINFYVGHPYGSVAANQTRGLVKWDISAMDILGDVQVTRATIQLYQTSIGYALPASGINVHAVLPANKDWTEMSATWNNLNKDIPTPWAGSAGLLTAGVDYDSTVLANLAITSASGWHTFDIPIALVQSWIDNPENNAGLILMLANPSEGSRVAFYASNISSVANPDLPHLVIDYVVPEPITLGLFSLGTLIVSRKRFVK